MKKLLCLAMTLGMTCSYAGESDVTDLMYLPKKGTFGAKLTLGSTSIDRDAKTSVGKVSSTTVDAFVYRTELLFAISDSFLASFQYDYLSEDKRKIKFGSGSNRNGEQETVKHFGPRDYIIKARQRIQEQAEGKLTIDLIGEFSPRSGKAEDASKDRKGNGYRGSTDVTIGLDLGKKQESSSFHFGGKLTFKGEVESKDLSDDSTTTVDSHRVLSGYFYYQSELQNSISFSIGGELNHTSSYDAKNTAVSNTTSWDPTRSVFFKGMLKYKIDPTLLLSAELSSESFESDAQSGTTPIEVESDEKRFGLSIFKQF